MRLITQLEPTPHTVATRLKLDYSATKISPSSSLHRTLKLFTIYINPPYNASLRATPAGVASTP